MRALDRDNVGHVIALDDTTGNCDILFVNDQGRSATRTMAWNELVVIDQPEPTALTEDAVETLQRIADDVEQASREWAATLASHGVEPGDADRFQRATNVACERAAHRLRALTRPSGSRTGSGAGPATGRAQPYGTAPSRRSRNTEQDADRRQNAGSRATATRTSSGRGLAGTDAADAA